MKNHIKSLENEQDEWMKRGREMKNTKVWIVENLSTNQQLYPQLEEAAAWIQRDEVVAFPTETVYGLGANALSPKAVEKIYLAKGRPSDNPLIVHISSVDMLDDLVAEIPDSAQRLMDAFWPGPLTMILLKKEGVPDRVTGGLSTVGIRMPAHPAALALITAADVPLAAPSANLSGKPSPTQIRHVIEDMNGRIPIILDGGEASIGIESTIVDCSSSIPVILRPGHVTKPEIEAVLGMAVLQSEGTSHTKKDVPKAPGMKYRHYAPKAPLILVEQDLGVLQQEVNRQKLQKKRVGVLTTEEFSQQVRGADRVYSLGEAQALETVSHRLYDGLRNFDDYQMDVIVATGVRADGVGQAIMNRLQKASETK